MRRIGQVAETSNPEIALWKRNVRPVKTETNAHRSPLDSSRHSAIRRRKMTFTRDTMENRESEIGPLRASRINPDEIVA